MNMFVMVLGTDNECFQNLVSIPVLDLSFVKLSAAGVFDGPKLSALVLDEDFERNVNDKRRQHECISW